MQGAPGEDMPQAGVRGLGISTRAHRKAVAASLALPFLLL